MAVHEVLPCPGVRFEPGFVRRLEALADRLALAREHREGAGVMGRLGTGAEFVGYRPYTRGDDLRALDWDLFARSRRPWVRVARLEAGERWRVDLDGSASMGVGPPGKLQRAAEVAAGIAALGVKRGAEVTIAASGGESGPREFTARRRSDVARLLAFLELLRAGGRATGHARGRVPAHVARLFLVGDLRDLEPESALSLRAPGRAVEVFQILAPVEIAPPREGDVEWWDPESGERLVLALDPRIADAYGTALSSEVAIWARLCASAGVPYRCSSSAHGFEEILGKNQAA